MFGDKAEVGGGENYSHLEEFVWTTPFGALVFNARGLRDFGVADISMNKFFLHKSHYRICHRSVQIPLSICSLTA